MITWAADLSLSDLLLQLGYTHRAGVRVGLGHRDVIDASGVVVMTGTYLEVVDWLRETGRIA